MRLKHDKTLITGKPGVGKTTLIQQIVEKMEPNTHKNIKGSHRVGKYGVDTQGFDEFLGELDLVSTEAALILIDEIGKMELFSKRFREMVRDLLDSDKQLLATVALKGGEFISEIKGRSDVHLMEVTAKNRDHLLESIIEIHKK